MTQNQLSSEDYRLKKTAVALDFDHTLFDCDRLLSVLTIAVTRGLLIPGTAQDLWDEASDQRLDRNESSYKYFIELIAMRASEHCGRKIEVQDVVRSIEHVTQLTGEGLVLGDAMSLLNNIEKQKDKDFYILTKGNPGFQRMKIDASGVTQFIKPDQLAAEPMRSRVLITTDFKGPYVYELSKHYQRVVFVDDKIEQLASVATFMRDVGVEDYPVTYGLILRRGTVLDGGIFSWSERLREQHLYFIPSLHPWVLKLCDK